jgi:hypothetical protein
MNKELVDLINHQIKVFMNTRKMDNNNSSSNDNKYNNDNDNDNGNHEGNGRGEHITQEAQRQKESDAILKQSEAVHKSSEVFSELKEKAEAAVARGDPSAVGASDDLMQTVRFLIMSEQTDALSSVLKRLNGDKEAWETVQREPVALLAMIIEESQKRMGDLKKKVDEALSAGKPASTAITGDSNSS